MKGERIYNSLSLVDEKYIAESAPVIGADRKRVWLKWVAAAACMCLVIGVAAVTVMRSFPGGKTVQGQLLAATKSSGAVDTAARETVLPVEGRIAVYEQIYVGSSAAVDRPDSPDSTEKLLPFVGEIYIQYGESSWYRVKGMDEIKYLISEDTAGTLRLWEYRSFLVIDSIFAEAVQGVEATEDELAEILAETENNIRAQFPDADLSPYTYGDVYHIIYNVESADDIVSIKSAPSKSNNTDLGKKIQKQVGTHTYDDRESIAVFYDITVNVVCNSAASWEFSNSERDRYIYSFSTDEDDKLTSGEETWASRYLTITLRSGTTIDSWKYTALSGRFYEFGGIFTEPLADTQVYEINSIFGIE